MNIKEIQKKIDETEYWDLEILDLNINYFGDEVVLIIYDSDKTSWKISFLSCYKVKYETDANWRQINNVKEMKKPQLGYYGQDITLSESEEFIEVSMDLSIMTINLQCRDIIVEKIKTSNDDFFWSENNI